MIYLSLPVRDDGTLMAVGSPYPVEGGARSVAVGHVARQ
jgi:hypothetical protein